MPTQTTLVTRRRLLGLGALGAATAVLAACGGPTASPTAAPKAAEPTKPAAPAAAATTAPAAKPAEPTKPAAAATTAPAAAAKPAGGAAVTLKVIYWSSSPQDNKVFNDTFNAFSEKNPGIKVEFDDIPSAEFVQKATTMIVGGTPPDAMELHPAWVINFIAANQLNDLTDLMKNDKAAFIPAQLEFWTHQGKQYGVPYYSGPSFMFYNKTLFKKVGAKTPEEHAKEGTWTWDTVRALSKQLTTGSGADKTYGWDASSNAAGAAALQFYTCVPIWCNQGELVDKDETTWLLDQPPVVEVMQWHADMALVDKSIPQASDTQGVNWLFTTGRLGMAWAGRFRSIELVNAPFEVGQVGTPKGKVGPINRDGPNATGLPTNTKHVAEAYKFANFIGSEDGAPFYLSSGRTLPVRTALIESDYFKKSLKPYERLEVFQESLKTVRAWRVPGRGAEALRIFQAEWDKVLVGQQDVKTAMANAVKLMNPTLKLK